MTETRLRTLIHGLAYGFTLLVLVVWGYLNLRYGLYDLFFGALAMGALAVAGVGYTIWARRRQLKAAGHGTVLGAMALIGVLLTLRYPMLAVFWLFPLIMLDLLILPLRRGVLLAALTVLLAGLVMLIHAQGLMAVASLLSAVVLGAMAALFTYRYHHHARSVGELTVTDPITGAYNSRFFDETLRREISRSEVTGHPLSLLHLGIDFFHELEELHGATHLHPLLEQTSETLRQTIRAGDSHYYLGQGEFLLLLPFTPEEGVRVIAERVRRVIAEKLWPTVESMTASLGGVSWHPGDQNQEVLVNGANRALDEARKRGHDRTYHLASLDALPGAALKS